MIIQFNERELDTDEYDISFDGAFRADYGRDSFHDIMVALQIEEDEVAFSLDYGEDGLPESVDSLVDSSIHQWVKLYNEQILEPYADKETNTLMNEVGEFGLELLYLYQFELAADSDENDEQYEILRHLSEEMTPTSRGYEVVTSVVNAYQAGRLRADETYVLVKIRFTDASANDL